METGAAATSRVAEPEGTRPPAPRSWATSRPSRSPPGPSSRARAPERGRGDPRPFRPAACLAAHLHVPHSSTALVGAPRAPWGMSAANVAWKYFVLFGRDGEIRTRDPLNPIQVRYQAAPRPDRDDRCYRNRAMMTSSSRLVSTRARRSLSTSSRPALSSRIAAGAAGMMPALASSARRFLAPATVKRSS